MNTYKSSDDASGLRFAIVVSRFNQPISVKLLEGCSAELIRCGARREDIDVVWVPGAFEIPIVARALASSGRYDALVALGSVHQALKFTIIMTQYNIEILGDLVDDIVTSSTCWMNFL